MNTEALLNWYASSKRELPWRNTRDPYLIWLSEVILQQTRVSQGVGYYYRFVENFPTLKDLAQADLDKVLSLWQGLGYYSRARNLHHAAQCIAKCDSFPDNYNDLLKIKGVGSYTAAAIASFAFNEAVAVLDGNVMRVLARQFEVCTNILSTPAKKELQFIADQILPKDQSADFNQAIMELGALICKPKNPACGLCPVRETCQAFKQNLQDQLPVRKANKNRKIRFIKYLIFCNEEFVLMKKRGKGDIWEGLYDFFSQENQHKVDEFIVEQKIDCQELELISSFVHKLTHQDLQIEGWLCKVEDLDLVCEKFGLQAFRFAKLAEVAKPTAIAKLLKTLKAFQKRIALNY